MWKGFPFMAKKSETTQNEKQNESEEQVEKLNRMLSRVMDYISDDSVEVIDIEYLLDSTEGLREWWEQYQEQNKKKLVEEIKKALSTLSLEQLESIKKLMET